MLLMQESTVTTKGQTTVPQSIRDSLHTQAGMKLHWHTMPDGTVIVRAKNKSVLDMKGSMIPPTGKRVAVSQMNAWQ